MEPPQKNNTKENTLIYIPRAYLPEDTGAIGFIFNDENKEHPQGVEEGPRGEVFKGAVPGHRGRGEAGRND